MASILDLPSEIIDSITTHIGKSTRYTAALACKRLSEVITPELTLPLHDTAAFDGHIGILRWAITRGYIPTAQTMSSAAAGGHLDIILYLRGARCPWDWETVENAAENGHIDVYKYAIEHGCYYEITALEAAAGNGHLDILKYAFDHNITVSCDDNTDMWPGLHRYRQMLYGGGVPASEMLAYTAAKYGHINIVSWFKNKHHIWSPSVRGALESANISVLDWLNDNGVQSESKWWKIAVSTQNIESLDWLYAHGCPDSHVVRKHGRNFPKIIEWADKHRI